MPQNGFKNAFELKKRFETIVDQNPKASLPVQLVH